MTARHIDRAVVALAMQQHTVFARRQAEQVGATDDLIERRLAADAWLQHARLVYGLPGKELDFIGRLWVAHLATGPRSVVSHEAAAALHGLTGFPRQRLTLTVPYPDHVRLSGVFTHQTRREQPTVSIEGLPVVDVPGTFVDLGAVARRGRLTIALEDALSAKRITTAAIGRRLAERARPGRKGIRLMAAILDEKGPGYVPPASALERLMLRVLREGGLPAPRRQFAFPGQVFTEGCVDAAYPDAKLILEADGRRWHTRVQDLARDHQRDQEAARAGWLTLRLLHEQLRDEPHETCELVRQTRAIRLERAA